MTIERLENLANDTDPLKVLDWEYKLQKYYELLDLTSRKNGRHFMSLFIFSRKEKLNKLNNII